MATTKKTAAKKNPIDDNKIISLYMDYVLSHQATPKNIFTFAKKMLLKKPIFIRSSVRSETCVK